MVLLGSSNGAVIIYTGIFSQKVTAVFKKIVTTHNAQFYPSAYKRSPEHMPRAPFHIGFLTAP